MLAQHTHRIRLAQQRDRLEIARRTTRIGPACRRARRQQSLQVTQVCGALDIIGSAAAKGSDSGDHRRLRTEQRICDTRRLPRAAGHGGR